MIVVDRLMSIVCEVNLENKSRVERVAAEDLFGFISWVSRCCGGYDESSRSVCTVKLFIGSDVTDFCRGCGAENVRKSVTC